MDDKFKVYDEVCATVTHWLMSNILEHPEPFCITNVDYQDKEDLCILSILNYVQMLMDKPIHYSGSYFKFLILKYIKKFKYLHYAKPNILMFTINIHNFENEVMISLNKHISLLSEIYDEYYRR